MALKKRVASILDSISGYFFFAGLITSKLKTIPLMLLSPIFNLASLIAYLVGYVTWHIAALCYPHHPRKPKHWYSFAELKEQYQLAALIGTLATVLCFAFPPLIVPALWLYTISNILWSIAEYHKKEHPPAHDETFSSTKQALYVRYAVLVTIASIITTIAATAILFFPPMGFALLLGASIVGGTLTAIAFYYWGKSSFGKHQPDKINHSYLAVPSNEPPPITNDSTPELTRNAAPLCFFEQSTKVVSSSHELETPEQDTPLSEVASSGSLPSLTLVR